MDELARYNQERWDALARAGVPYSRPMLDLTPESARRLVDAEGALDEPAGRDVLCLAGDQHWTIDPGEGRPPVRVLGPREFIHLVPTVINGLIGRGFTILGLWEGRRGDPAAAPGTWQHMTSLVPANVTVWARK
ncbi:MAG: hypothetical protein BIFFINMI_04374 [Phycisphaerae bacterium]|nr:hypothetical protein [Phycisphaerae bacterium]